MKRFCKVPLWTVALLMTLMIEGTSAAETYGPPAPAGYLAQQISAISEKASRWWGSLKEKFGGKKSDEKVAQQSAPNKTSASEPVAVESSDSSLFSRLAERLSLT